MAGKINIGGTEYNDISSGEVNIGGALHSISSGLAGLADGGTGDIELTDNYSYEMTYEEAGTFDWTPKKTGYYEVILVGGSGGGGGALYLTPATAQVAVSGNGGGSGYITESQLIFNQDVAYTLIVGKGGTLDIILQAVDSSTLVSQQGSPVFGDSGKNGYPSSIEKGGQKLISADGGEGGLSNGIVYLSNQQIISVNQTGGGQGLDPGSQGNIQHTNSLWTGGEGGQSYVSSLDKTFKGGGGVSIRYQSGAYNSYGDGVGSDGLIYIKYIGKEI